MKGYVIGLDNGGTVIKAAIFDLEGHEIAVSSRQTPLLTPRPGFMERDMDELWRKNCECLSEVLSASKVPSQEIIGLAVCGHGKGLYACGSDGEPVRNGIVSTDNRAWQYPQKWKREGAAEELYPLLCQRILPCQQLSLLAWLKDHERESYDRIRWAFSVKDYIRFRLTGEAYSEATDISGSGLMNVRDARFDAAILERFGIGEAIGMIAPLRYSSERCGAVTAAAARLTGLVEGTPVAGGMFDIDACAVAMDISSPEQLCTITGTWSINEFISTRPITASGVAMNSLYAIPGYYLLEECSATSAGNLEWFTKNLLACEAMAEGKSVYQIADDLVSSVDPTDSDVYYLPFLYGSNVHPLAKGSLVGLSTYHSMAHVIRAVFEGVAFSHKTHIDRLLSVRSRPRAVRMAGGATNSPQWIQMFADVLDLPIETVRGVKELGALGCAMSATIAAGVYRSYSEAASAMVRIGRPVLPKPAAASAYRIKFEKYSAICASLDAVWDRFKI